MANTPATAGSSERGSAPATAARGSVAERLRLLLANTLNKLVFFPLSNLGDWADHVGGDVYHWAERQR